MYEPYPVPELAREHKRFRYSSLWAFAKQDLRLLAFLLVIAACIGLGLGYFWAGIFIAFLIFLACSFGRCILSMNGSRIVPTIPRPI